MVSVPRFSTGFYRCVTLFLILTVVFLAHSLSLNNGFVNWDDDVHLTENPAVLSLDASNIKEIFTTTVNHTYIPLTVLSFAVEHYFFGYNPLFYHLNNILLHLVVTALIIAFARRLGLSFVAAGLAGLIFGIHPLHVESVAWVTERKDVLYAVFYMLSLLVYLRYLDARRAKYLILSIMLAVLSMLAKPMALSLPLVLVVCDWFYAGRLKWRDIFNKFYYLAFLGPIAWATYVFHADMVEPQAWSNVLVWIWCFMFYLGKFLVPGETMLFYPLPFPVALHNPSYLFTIIYFIAFCALLWIGRRNRLLLFAAMFYTVSIFFLLRFNVTLDGVADRFMYLPSAGWCMFVAVAVEKAWANSKRNIPVFYGILIALAMVLSGAVAQTQARTLVWRDSVALWSNQLEGNTQTGTWAAYTKLADAYAEQGKLPEALNAYQRAIERKGNVADPYFGMADVYKTMGDLDEAAALYAEALRHDPRHFQALFELARIYQSRGRAEEALALDRRAIEANPLNEKIYRAVLATYQDDQIIGPQIQTLLGK
jgi:protein O-mannosyl-transferase